MIFDYFDEINWLAVLVAAAAFFALGAIWYSSALFGKQYRAAIGAEEAGSPAAGPLVVNFAAWVVAALALALISKGIGASTVVDGLVLGLVVSIGFIGTTGIVAQFYEGRTSALMAVNAPYYILGYMLMGLILAIWK